MGFFISMAMVLAAPADVLFLSRGQKALALGSSRLNLCCILNDGNTMGLATRFHSTVPVMDLEDDHYATRCATARVCRGL